MASTGPVPAAALLLLASLAVAQGLEFLVSEQATTALRPSRLVVQTITEPENLIRLFEGLDLGFEMARHWARNGLGLLRLPFSGLGRRQDPWERPGFVRMLAIGPEEAPRYLRGYV